MATAGRVVFEKSHKPYSTLFSVSQITRFTVEVVIKNGTQEGEGLTAVGTPGSPGSYPHGIEKHWPKPFKLEEQAISREI